MSSKMNHRKRSRVSEHNKGGAFRAAARQAYYRDGVQNRNRSLLGRLFHRRAPKPAQTSAHEAAQD